MDIISPTEIDFSKTSWCLLATILLLNITINDVAYIEVTLFERKGNIKKFTIIFIELLDFILGCRAPP